MPEIQILSNLWGKVLIFKGGYEYHLITPKIIHNFFYQFQPIPSHALNKFYLTRYEHKYFKVEKFLSSLQTWGLEILTAEKNSVI